MIAALEFIFSSFWVFIGTLILFCITAQVGLALILGAVEICTKGRK